ncbi:MAG TPA: triacylglycerol lipase [Methylibium sp.]|nr:triacylglycerol lipase [Methylibium sp.]
MKRFATRSIAAAALGLALLAGPAAGADSYTQTRYPIVLVHGALGFDTIGPVNYWFGIATSLRDGGATVFQPQVSALNGNAVRGEQLLAQLRELKAAHGYTRFNLVGHSQGGITSRYVAEMAPELVASVTTVGTPHQGTPVADGVNRDTAAAGVSGLVFSILSALGNVISLLSGEPQLPQDAAATFGDSSTTSAAAFNTQFPAGLPSTPCGQGPATAHGARLYSAGGTAVLTNPADASDGLLLLTSTYFEGAANDGLVGRCSTHFGQVLRDDYPWNHLDEVNMVFGLRGLFTPSPVAFYRSHANRLKLAGL